MSWISQLIKSPKRLLVFFLVTTIILITTCLLEVNSRYIRTKVEKRISKVIKVPFRYEKARLSGLNQISLKGVTCGKQVTISEAKASLDIRKTLGTRTLHLSKISLDSPCISLDLDKVEKNLKEAVKNQVKPPAIALAQQAKKRASAVTKSTPKLKKKQPVNTKEPLAKPPASKKPKPQVHYPAIAFTNTKLILHSQRLPQKTLSLEGISLKTKAGTNKAEGFARWKSPNSDINLKLPIILQGRTLTLPKSTHDILGAQIITAGKIGLVSSLPCALEFHFATTSPIDYQLPNDDMISVHLDRLQMQGMLQGSLASPFSLQAIAQSNLSNFAPRHKTRGEHNFETGSVDLGLRNGQLHIPSYALRSEELSLIGNGQGSVNEFNLVCRTIANDIWAEHGIKLIHGLRIPSNRRVFSPLETEDRFYKDGYIKITPERGVEFTLHPKKKWTTLGTCWKSAKRFLTRELWTEEQ